MAVRSRLIRSQYCSLMFAMVTISLGLLLSASCALAAPKIKWRAVTDSNLRNIDRLSLFRDTNNTLHLAWAHTGVSSAEILYRRISSNGVIDTPIETALSGWPTLTNPSVLMDSGGRVSIYFGGIGPYSPYLDGNLATVRKPNGGTVWVLEPGVLSSSNIAYASDAIRSALDLTGKPYHTFAAVSAIHFISELPSEVTTTRPSCCIYQSNLALDKQSGSMIAGWYSNVSGEHGLYLQQVLPTSGLPQLLPGSATPDGNASLSLSSPIPLTSRPGLAGVYSAYCMGYPTCSAIQVASFGGAGATTVPRSKRASAHMISIASGPKATMWVAWIRGRKVYLSKSTKAVPRFKRPAVFKGPPLSKHASYWAISASAYSSGVDLFVHAGAENTNATFHARVK